MRPARLSPRTTAQQNDDSVTLLQEPAIEGEIQRVTLTQESARALLPLLERWLARHERAPEPGGSGASQGRKRPRRADPKL